MKSKFAAVIVGVALLTAMSHAPAKATTYDYVGNPFFSCASVAWVNGCSVPPFHTGLTGSVTFNFNTFGFSGTVIDGPSRDPFDMQIVDLQLDGISFEFHSFTLSDGAITQWFLGGIDSSIVSSNGGDIFAMFGCGSPVDLVCNYYSNSTPGVWTPVDLAPVPGPIAGAGRCAVVCGTRPSASRFPRPGRLLLGRR
jgi:hypothetical protein